MDPSQFAGMSWDAWTNHVENLWKEPFDKVESAVNKLNKEDMEVFGVLVDSEPLKLHDCKECGMIVKAQALFHHYARRHMGTLSKISSCEESSSKMTEREDSSVAASSLFKPISENLILADPESDMDVVSQNVKDKSKLTSAPTSTTRRLKRLETNRPPLGQVCPNRWHEKKKISHTKNELKDKEFPLLNRSSVLVQEEKMETNSAIKETNDEVDYLLHQLPEMKLNSSEEEQACSKDTARQISPNDSVLFMSTQPRALSTTPLFSYHKAGGLLYPGRHMKMTRRIVQQAFSDDEVIIPTNLLQQLKVRRRNTIYRKKK